MLTLAVDSALAARLSGSPIHLMNIDYWLWEQDPASCQEALDGESHAWLSPCQCLGCFSFFSLLLHSSVWLDWKTFCLLSSASQRPTGSEIRSDRTAAFAVLDPLGATDPSYWQLSFMLTLMVLEWDMFTSKDFEVYPYSCHHCSFSSFIVCSELVIIAKTFRDCYREVGATSPGRVSSLGASSQSWVSHHRKANPCQARRLQVENWIFESLVNDLRCDVAPTLQDLVMKFN